MSHRPWTAIMSENGKITALDVTASIEKNKARSELEVRYPGRYVVALIPGTHASYTFTFRDMSGSEVRNSKAYIDPFDTSHIVKVSF